LNWFAGAGLRGSKKPRATAMAREAARMLAERGLPVIAGSAEGIDGGAHH
jgi:predicted Rossmann fold nucleotide-binding protein DprA/Smf involved in DNA uptake